MIEDANLGYIFRNHGTPAPYASDEANERARRIYALCKCNDCLTPCKWKNSPERAPIEAGGQGLCANLPDGIRWIGAEGETHQIPDNVIAEIVERVRQEMKE